MKTSFNYYVPFVQLLIVVGILFNVYSCNENQHPEVGLKEKKEKIDPEVDNIKREKDIEFMKEAAEINLEEIQLGQLAQRKGYTADVKSIGEMMDSDQTRALSDLTELANKKMIVLPTMPSENMKRSYIELSSFSGKAFDKEFCKQMVQKHKNTIELFEKASVELMDPDIKAWATLLLPSLRVHLDNSIVCQNKCERTK